MKNLRFPFILLLAVLTSCHEDVKLELALNDSEESSMQVLSSENSISESDALRVATKFNAGVPATRSQKEVADITTIDDESGNPVLYVVNYAKDQGFVLIGSSKNYHPILAYNGKGNFDLSDLPAGLNTWIKNVTESIKLANALPKDSTIVYRAEWNKYAEQPTSTRATTRAEGLDAYTIKITGEWEKEGIPYVPLKYADEILPTDVYQSWCEQAEGTLWPTYQGIYDPLTYSFVIHPTIDMGSGKVENLLSTKWGEICGFNDSIPHPYSDTIPPLGSHTIAMAQVMRYHEYPSDYEWNLMHDSIPTPATQGFLYGVAKNIGTKFGKEDSFSSLANIANSLKNNYGYLSGDPIAYSQGKVFDEITARRPVIMEGKSNVNGNIYAWIACGYDRSNHYSEYRLVVPVCDYVTEEPYKVIDTYDTQQRYNRNLIYINWGKFGRRNGYYESNNIAFEYANFEYSFNEDRKDIIGIKPNK